MYVMPGFIDMHVHAGGPPKNAEAEYPYKLWLAHGVTTVRGVPLADFDITVSEKQRSERNEIVAPRIFDYPRPAQGWDRGPSATTPPRRAPGSAGRLNAASTASSSATPNAATRRSPRRCSTKRSKRALGSTAHLAQICCSRPARRT